MTNNPIENRLRELSWRQKLTGAEAAELRAGLAAHPEAQADCEAESGLNELLGRLPDVPVASNFTARVLQAVERESAPKPGRPGLQFRLWQWRPRWLPRAAFAAVILSVGLVSYHHARGGVRRAELARSVAAVSDVSSLPSPEILANFDTIYALNPTPPADEELLALLK
jgi:anti-sigma factor RsiW